MSDRDFNDAAKRRQGEKLQTERDEAARQKRLAAQQESAKRKPRAQAGMTAIESRIIARAERHAKIAAEVRAGNYGTAKPKPSARLRWDEAIESATVECNGDRRRAVEMVVKRNPKLREALVTEANAGR